MLTKIKNSFVFRSQSLYKFFLSTIPITKKKDKEGLDFTLLILTGKKQVSMLLECIHSFYLSNPALPQIRIVLDGSIGKEEILKHLKWYPNSIQIITREECLEYHSRLNNREKLVDFAIKNPMGLKMAAILQSAEYSPTFYCDTDVLWFKPITALVQQNILASNGFFIKMSEDYQPAYDQNMLTQHFQNLGQKPFFCAGLMFIKGSIEEKFDIGPILEDANISSNHFTEQTIFAGINRRFLNGFWPNEELIACFQYDQISHKPTYFGKNWVVRHYVGPVRHLFWRDAFFLRIGFKP